MASGDLMLVRSRLGVALVLGPVAIPRKLKTRCRLTFGRSAAESPVVVGGGETLLAFVLACFGFVVAIPWRN